MIYLAYKFIYLESC